MLTAVNAPHTPPPHPPDPPPPPHRPHPRPPPPPLPAPVFCFSEAEGTAPGTARRAPAPPRRARSPGSPRGRGTPCRGRRLSPAGFRLGGFFGGVSFGWVFGWVVAEYIYIYTSMWQIPKIGGPNLFGCFQVGFPWLTLEGEQHFSICSSFHNKQNVKCFATTMKFRVAGGSWWNAFGGLQKMGAQMPNGNVCWEMEARTKICAFLGGVRLTHSDCVGVFLQK